MTRRPARNRLLAGVLTGAAVVTLAAVSSPATAEPTPTPKPSPSASALPGAADEANRAGERIAVLQRRITAQQKTLSRVTAAASLAEQQYVRQLGALRVAQAAEARAAADVARAHAEYRRARTAFVHVIVATYETGGPVASSSTIQLLLSDDPGQALQDMAATELVTVSQGDIVHSLEHARAERIAAERTRRAALATVRTRTERLAAIRASAQRNLATAKTTLASLRTDLAAANVSQERAIAALSGYLGGWASADPSKATALDAKYRKIAASLIGRPPRFDPAHPKWTAAVGRYAAIRALRWLGTPYAWSGGDSRGPTRGVCTGGDAKNDCKLVGFDCSGLVLHAWAPYRGMAHFAATQYTQAGRVHPEVKELRAGDLVFWSNNSRTSGIHHVALYIGEGLVVQAPQSGDIVRVTPLAYVSSGYFGATRPLS